MNRHRQFKRVRANVKQGVEAMQKTQRCTHGYNVKNPTSGTVVPNVEAMQKLTLSSNELKVECYNCHTKNPATRCFCRKCETRLIHSYG